jgi:hypothetical protein
MADEIQTGLTRDNHQLSQPTMAQLGGAASVAINCTDGLPSSVANYVRDSLSDNSRKAYVSDLAEFERWGGSMPTSPEIVAGSRQVRFAGH